MHCSIPLPMSGNERYILRATASCIGEKEPVRILSC